MTFLDWISTAQSRLKAIAPYSSVRAQILNNPYYRFQTLEELELAVSLGVTIDANQAGVDDWLRLPGLSIHQARTLTELAQSGVHFHCLEDLAAALSVPVQRLKPLEPIIQFCYYDGSSVYTIQPINPNTATVEMLVRIPRVDLYLARAIVENRILGPYRNLIHLQRRLSLPGDLTTELMHYLKF